jgi:hypothetical protein
MKVHELIKKLQECDQDLPIFIWRNDGELFDFDIDDQISDRVDINILKEEKYTYNEKQMQWVLRGILSTNAWENIDELVEQYDLQRDELRERNLDDYRGDDPTPSKDEVLDSLFKYFTEDAKEGEMRKLWYEINQYIEKEKQA